MGDSMASIQEHILQLKQQFLLDLQSIKTSRDVDRLKVRYLSKKGPVQHLVGELSGISAERKPSIGKLINDLKLEITSALEQALSGVGLLEEADRLAQEKEDITLPARRSYLGRAHPLSLMMEEVLDVFISLGFSIQYGPDIDSDYYNFEGLNYPQDHPARDMQDTFYVAENVLLRSHTSNTQLRVMESHKPPIRVAVPGTCYRNETVSARSHVLFHQVEGMYIDDNVSLSDLMTTVEVFLSRIFRQDVETRFRPSFFPFVEPGVEVDVRCTSCSGRGCRLCKQSGWLEVLGAGMIHPEVLKNGGIDPELYSGYAWGLGIERLAMLRYGIQDIRMFTENDLRFLEQF
jgi:phenylalanyl-tRNA synthetase alpha chain